MGMFDKLLANLKASRKTIVFTEGTDPRILSAAERLMKENLQKLNKLIPGYSQVSHIEIKEEPFEKTPKKSIKRFLYK